MTLETLLIVAGAFAGAFVNGLTGFGTGMTALVFWLHAMPAPVAAPLVVVCSVIAQLQSLRTIWRAIDMRRLAPFVAGGLVGIPLGAWLLLRVPVGASKLGLGILLIVYCAIMLLGRFRPTINWGGRSADGAVGLGGGVLGGLAGLSGPLPSVWASLRGWGRDERRAVFQGFNLAILGVTLAVHAAAGLVTQDVLRALLLALPATLFGAFVGQRVYRRLDDHRFDRLILVVLLIAGCLLVWSGR
jgi:hypothetical protein